MSETLHELIQSLDTTEKSYFKKFAHKSNRAKSEDYYKLFDSIDKQDCYNEKQVLKKNSHLKTSKQLAAAKNYLYHLILNSLCDYHRKKSIRAQLHQQLEQIEVLCAKSLFHQAKKIVLKAKKKALKYELFPYLMEFQEWEEKINRIYFDKYGILEYNELKFKEEYHTIKQWKNYRQYREIVNKIVELQLTQALSKITKEQTEIKKLINAFLMQEGNKPLSNSAQSFYYYIQNCLGQMENDQEASYQAKKAHLKLLERETAFREMKPLRYISILVNLSMNKDGTEALKYLEMLEKVTTKTSQEALFRDTFLGCNWLLYYTNTKSSADHLDEIYSLGEKLKEYPKFKHTLYYDRFVYFMIYNYFLAKEYHTALEWAEYYQQNMNKNPSIQYNLGVKVLSILSNYELGDDFFVNYIGDTAYRIISKQDAAYRIESTLILFLKHLMKLPKYSSKKEHFQKLKKDLEQIEFEVEGDGLFNLIEWVDEKIAQYNLSLGS